MYNYTLITHATETVLQAGQINPSGQRNRTKKAAHAALSGNNSTNSLYVFG